MTTCMAWARAALSLAFLSGAPVLGAQLQPNEIESRAVVKRYTELSPAFAYRAAVEGTRADVRFSDAFAGLAPVPLDFQVVRLRGELYRNVLAFRTDTDLYCLIAARNMRAIERARSLRMGQTVTVEGTILGTAQQRRCIMVDRVLSGREKPSKITHDLLVGWPGVPDVKPKFLLRPGTYNPEFPCRHVENQKEKVRITVVEKKRAQFERELREERGVAPRVYAPFTAAKVYQYAREGRSADVEFSDRFKSQAPRDRALAGALVPGRGRYATGFAFDTYTGLTCIVPFNNPTLNLKVSAAIRGQMMQIKGTIAGKQGPYYCVLVDEVDFPDLSGTREEPPVWNVSIQVGNEPPVSLHIPGTYVLNLPCQFAQGKTETLALRLREVRIVEGEGVTAPEKTGEQTAKDKDGQTSPGQGGRETR